MEEKQIKPEEIIIPLYVLKEMLDAFEKACEICEIDSEKTKLTIVL